MAGSPFADCGARPHHAGGSSAPAARGERRPAARGTAPGRPRPTDPRPPPPAGPDAAAAAPLVAGHDAGARAAAPRDGAKSARGAAGKRSRAGRGGAGLLAPPLLQPRAPAGARRALPRQARPNAPAPGPASRSTPPPRAPQKQDVELQEQALAGLERAQAAYVCHAFAANVVALSALLTPDQCAELYVQSHPHIPM